MRHNPIVCFEADREERLDPAGSPENISMKWESLIGTGRAQFVEDFAEKKALLEILMRLYGRYNPHYRAETLSEARVRGVTVFKIVLDEFKAKRIWHD
jgi:nitroimidazol reductase NimA-like FMN-containing flavoprotein (pyridoxamine 5'-phosphate oxidase superfamily)